MELELMDTFKELKHDCMWSGQCDCSSRTSSSNCSNASVENLLSKSPMFASDFNDVLLVNSLYTSQMINSSNVDPMDLLDSLDSNDLDFSAFISSGSNNSNNTSNNNQNQTTFSNNTIAAGASLLQNQSQTNSSSNSNSSSSNNNSSTISSSQPIPVPTTNSSNSYNNLNSLSNRNGTIQLCSPNTHNSTGLISGSHLLSTSNSSTSNLYLNDLLLSSTSGNLSLAQQSNNINGNCNNTLNNTNTNYISSVNNPNNSSAFMSTSPYAALNSTINPSSVSFLFNTGDGSFDSQFLYSNANAGDCTPFSCTTDSSSNSECGSSLMMERTDYDTEDIEEDLDLLEDIIEEEIDDQGLLNFNPDYYQRSDSAGSNTISSGASGYGSASVHSVDSEFELLSSPISDSLINDHNYGPLANFGLPIVGAKCTIIDTPLNGLDAITTTTTTTSSRSQNRKNGRSNGNSKRSNQNRLNGPIGISLKNTNKSNSSSVSLPVGLKTKKVMDLERRKEHNESERMRRDVLKNAFLTLRNKCPKLQTSTKKSSRIQILNEATSYITQINEKEKLLEKMKQQEMQRKAALLNRLRALSCN